MKTKPLTFLLALTFLLLFSGSSVVLGDDLQDGEDAAKRGDYKTAHRLWLPLAKQGNANALCNLGLMHIEGNGVPESLERAAHWINLAHRQGSERAAEMLDEYGLWDYIWQIKI